MTSIRHFPATHPLPDWRNFGIMLRVLLGVNLLALLMALAQVAELVHWPARYLELAAAVEPLLLLMLVLLSLLRDLLWRLPLRLGQGAVLLLAGGLAAGFAGYARALGLVEGGSLERAVTLALISAVVVLAYFESRARAISPALVEARLAALNARIRPHFLFNSLNAVLSLIRAQPQQAEAALESLAELFRAALRDPSEMVGLGDEIDLARQYLELEKLRLGERLAVDWQLGEFSPAQPIPPMLLQPLLENAVYHGIEPAAEGGVVSIAIARRGEELQLAIANPVTPGGRPGSGNHLALDNIRERLSLYYDLEARLQIEASATRYEVRITLPCRRQRS